MHDVDHQVLLAELQPDTLYRHINALDVLGRLGGQDQMVFNFKDVKGLQGLSIIDANDVL
jgi:hypothetical protein